MSTPSDRFAPPRRYPRFARAHRIQHLVMLVSFLVLAATGLPQKFIYLNVHLLDWIIDAMGGIEAVRVIHRVAATLLMLATAYHLLDVAYRLYVRRVALSMLPGYKDLLDALQAVRYNLGLARQRPRMDRYTWEEKVEYWSLIWGTIVMIATGFMLWNPVATARFLPGQYIPAAQVVHGGEAVLAVLAVLVWHFYSVHLRHFNRSMFTGEMSEREMEDEHPLELERIRSGQQPSPAPEEIARRQRVFLPVAGLVALVLLAGIYWLVTFEQTAITTLRSR
ncbi:MAG TPA: cytochrome b/b6 domain-containing protein [Vicinamibacteria bacterium]|nr:cytochrome b/b6 domain-containing protein [Vicinamibacteria bacterium]